MDNTKAHPLSLLWNLTSIYIERIACNCVLCTHYIVICKEEGIHNTEKNQYLIMRNIFFHELVRLLIFSCKFSYIV